MKNLLIKEFRLAASPISFIFIAFSFMTFIPGYPILCGAFFVCLGLFHSFQHSREENDILYTLMLPVKKSEVVSAKYLFVVSLQTAAFIIMAIFATVRMTLLSDMAVYRNNALMSANPLFLAFVLLIFLSFNSLFVGGFYRTAYKFSGPFIGFSAVTFLLIAVGETLHHIPGLSFLNATEGDALLVPCIILVLTVIFYIFGTYISCRKAQKTFEKIDI